MEEEKLRNHARTTQTIYEDVSKVLKEKNQQEFKRRVKEAKEELEVQASERVRKVENQMTAQLALERKAKGQVELKNALLEQKIEEMKDKMK